MRRPCSSGASVVRDRRGGSCRAGYAADDGSDACRSATAGRRMPRRGLSARRAPRRPPTRRSRRAIVGGAKVPITQYPWQVAIVDRVRRRTPTTASSAAASSSTRCTSSRPRTASTSRRRAACPRPGNTRDVVAGLTDLGANPLPADGAARSRSPRGARCRAYDFASRTALSPWDAALATLDRRRARPVRARPRGRRCSSAPATLTPAGRGAARERLGRHRSSGRYPTGAAGDRPARPSPTRTATSFYARRPGPPHDALRDRPGARLVQRRQRRAADAPSTGRCSASSAGGPTRARAPTVRRASTPSSRSPAIAAFVRDFARRPAGSSTRRRPRRRRRR